ncbi:MAG TPA: DegT/DnrJ/EryC1/StrS family aminotransferase, partial [Cyclobacteriaceae bacterium]|nr:DegT/DnrJ/EryC1/StrS family aminotransferase [Cyclobacteriaceae bacterium]
IGKKIFSVQDIKLVDIHGQYLGIRTDVQQAIQQVIDAADFIQGAPVREFERSLSNYLGGSSVISCGNGTDALQIAMMALEYKPGDEIIVPAFTYAATVEVLALLGLVPVFVDVDEDTFNIDVNSIAKVITSKTKAIVPVHLFGQCADMETLLKLAAAHRLDIIEDAAQSLGAKYTFSNGERKRSGCIGVIGATSFFPTKNLGAYGDGGAVFTSDPALAEKLRMIANHGQKKKYYHDIVGVNSRLDTLQAAILRVKLARLDEYESKRQQAAKWYDAHLAGVSSIIRPKRVPFSTHVFHQYTIRVKDGKRDALRQFLDGRNVPSMVYYPLPIHLQNAYRQSKYGPGSFPVSESLSTSVLSLPMHSELDEEQMSYICDSIGKFH